MAGETTTSRVGRMVWRLYFPEGRAHSARAHVTLVVAGVLVGFGLNLMVACACSVWGARFAHDGVEHLDEEMTGWWAANVPASWADKPRAATRHPGIGTHALLIAESDVDATAGNNVSRKFAGWPVVTLSGEIFVNSRQEIIDHRFIGGVKLGAVVSGNIPYRLIPMGALINSMFYGSIVIACFAVARRARAERRRRAGRCPWCGSAAQERGECPVCGTPLGLATAANTCA